MAYNGKSKRFKNAIMALVATVQYDGGGGAEPAFSQILDNNRLIFEGWPNAQVLPDMVSDTKETTAQVDRVVSYVVRLRMQLEDTDVSQSATYDHMYDLTDILLDLFDNTDFENTLSDAQGPLGIQFMDATHGQWQIVKAANGAVLIADIDLQITYSKNLV